MSPKQLSPVCVAELIILIGFQPEIKDYAADKLNLGLCDPMYQKGSVHLPNNAIVSTICLGLQNDTAKHTCIVSATLL